MNTTTTALRWPAVRAALAALALAAAVAAPATLIDHAGATTVTADPCICDYCCED